MPAAIAQEVKPSSNSEAVLEQVSSTDWVHPNECRTIILLWGGHPACPVPMAGGAGMSIRSFQRRLAENNLKYSRLIEQVRFDEAVDLLKDPTNKLIDIAILFD